MALPELYGNLFSTSLAQPCASGDSTITVVAAAPTAMQVPGQFRIIVDSEIMLVVGGQSGLVWNVLRGAATSEAPTPTVVAHGPGVPVVHVSTSGSMGGRSDAASTVPALRTLGRSAVQAAPGTAASGRGVSFSVAPSNAPAAVLGNADYVCTGANDDVTIMQAVSSLLGDGGIVHLLAGDYYFGPAVSNFINVNNEYGGVTIEGEGRRQGAVIHVPAGSAAPCALRMASWGGGSHTVRDLYVTFDGVPSGSTVGIWMQCNEPQVKDCVVNGAAGHGIVLDGAPVTVSQSVTAPSANTYSGSVVGCEVYQAGSAINSGGSPGDAFVATALSANAVFDRCFAIGGTGTASGLLAATLTSGNAYLTLSVSELTGPIAAGDQLVIANVSTNPISYQLVTASAPATQYATTVNVNSFVASGTFDGTSGLCFVADTKTMVTRDGFSLLGTAHINQCHPYWCYHTGLYANTVSLYATGGEFESNGWSNIFSLGSSFPESSPGSPESWVQIVGTACYGNAPYAGIFTLFTNPGVIVGNLVDGGYSYYGIVVQNATNAVVSGNVIQNAVAGFGTYGISVALQILNASSCVVTSNSGTSNLSPSGSYYGLSVYNSTNCVVSNNSFAVSGNDYSLGGGTSTGTIARGNVGYNPVGLVVVPVPGTGVPVGPVVYDRYFYVTAASTGTTTMEVAAGPTITIPVASLVLVFVPAGATLIPTYTSGAPTWQVYGA